MDFRTLDQPEGGSWKCKIRTVNFISLMILFFTAQIACQDRLRREQKDYNDLLSSSVLTAPSGEPNKGWQTFQRYCFYCHGEKGKLDGPNTPNLDPVPRAFNDLGHMSRLKDEDIFDIISGGGPEINRSVIMPPFGRVLTEEEIWDLVAFIRSLQEGREEFPRLEEGFASPTGDTAPNLSVVGSKLNRDWLLDFLKNPKTIRPLGFIPGTHSRMPNFRLTNEEAEAITDYLISRKDKDIESIKLEGISPERGERIFRREYGCHGCHKDKDQGGEVGPDLRGVNTRLKAKWIAKWVKNPQALQPYVIMPNYGLTDIAAKELAAYIMDLNGADRLEDKGPEADSNAVAKGKSLAEDLGCPVCHGFADLWTTVREEAPDLTFEGDKVRPGWLFNFLKEPHTLRPIIKARMPNFILTDEEALAITEFILTLKNKEAYVIPEEFRYPGKVSSALVKEGEKIFKLYKCRQCHPFKGELLEGDDTGKLAPDFLDAANRLNPDWIFQWLYDPQAIQEGVNMPSYFYSEGEPIVDEPEEEMVALRDYILSLEEEATFEAYYQAKKEYPNINPAEGKRLVNEINCRGCHVIPGLPLRKIGPQDDSQEED